MIKSGEVCLTQLDISLLPALFSLLPAINQKHSRAESLCYLHVHQPPSVAQEDWWEPAEKKGGGRGRFAAAKGNKSELKGHRGVHQALICSTGNRAGTCTTVSEYVGDGEAEGWGSGMGRKWRARKIDAKNRGRQSNGGERQETDRRGGWLSGFYGQI